MVKNRLIREKSPYLLLHADNPVDWYPWGQEAFDRATEMDMPIFLSIGYSTCHWCHVMERESFSDPKVAKLMNETFVSIKVDREERPDIDATYMAVCQMITGSGGWPLSIFMTPDKRPFLAGTYFSKEGAFGRPGLLDLVPKIKELWKHQREQMINSADTVVEGLRQLSIDSPGETLGVKVLDRAYERLEMDYDPLNGGFGRSPKFPSPQNMMFLLRYWQRTAQAKALEMVEGTLVGMRQGGIFDQLGHGFHRYSTDERWMIPHFEKMLYDQAMTVMTYVEAYQATKKEIYASTAKQIVGYVLRDMTSKEGGFLSAEDADSEGVEGKFYLWTKGEIMDVLGEVEGSFVSSVFTVLEEGNFQNEANGGTNGTNVLHLETPMNDETRKRIAPSIKRLFEHRERRPHPSKDDKILTDWNGLMIGALAKAGKVLGEKAYIDAAQRAADLILGSMRRQDGRLLHRSREGEAGILAYLDDHAFMIWGLLELYEATFSEDYLKEALVLVKDMKAHFWDADVGGFYSTSDDGEDLLVRQKITYDGAIPSGNSVAMHVLLRLAMMVDDGERIPDNARMAAMMARSYAEKVRGNPVAHTFLLSAVDMGIGPSFAVVIVGKVSDKDTIELLDTLNKDFLPNKVVILRPLDKDPLAIDDITGFTKDHIQVGGRTTAYVCSDRSCKEPSNDKETIMASLQTKRCKRKLVVKRFERGKR